MPYANLVGSGNSAALGASVTCANAGAAAATSATSNPAVAEERRRGVRARPSGGRLSRPRGDHRCVRGRRGHELVLTILPQTAVVVAYAHQEFTPHGAVGIEARGDLPQGRANQLGDRGRQTRL